MAARVTNIAGHSNHISRNPPSIGAAMGATPMPAVTMDMARCAAVPSYRSATIARAATGPAHAATPWTKRAGSSRDRLSADKHTTPASTYTVRPTSSTGRRPNLSEIGPSTNCARANPARNTPTTSCARPSGSPKASASAGKPAKGISMDRAVMPVKQVSRIMMARLIG